MFLKKLKEAKRKIEELTCEKEYHKSVCEHAEEARILLGDQKKLLLEYFSKEFKLRIVFQRPGHFTESYANMDGSDVLLPQETGETGAQHLESMGFKRLEIGRGNVMWVKQWNT